MKSKLLFALLGIAAMFTGCSQENVESFTANKTTSFKVSVDEGVQTRAGGNAPTRYIMEMYEGATTDGTPTRVEQAANTFDVILKDDQAYTVLFWADYGTANDASGANEYDAASLKAAKVAAGKQATKAAFAGKVSFTTGTDDANVYTAVTLKHAVAQANFKQTEVLTAATNTLTVTYPESYSMNVVDGSVTKIDGAVTHTFTYNKAEIGTLGTDYIIAATGETKTIMEIKATLNSETEKTIPNVSFGRNFRTNISGAYSNIYNATLTVTCDDSAWNENEEVEFPKAVSYAVGDPYPDATNPIGVVFYIERDDATKGKIVSLDETGDMVWSTESITTGVTDGDDGFANTNAIKNLPSYSADKYPPVAWCLNKGTRWYLPAWRELRTLTEAKDAVNSTLNSLSGATPLGNYNLYWTSGEYNDTKAMFVYYNGNSSSNIDKQSTDKEYIGVRAILAF